MMNEEKNTELSQMSPEQNTGGEGGTLPKDNPKKNVQAESSCQAEVPADEKAPEATGEDEPDDKQMREAQNKIKQLQSELEGLKKRLEATEAAMAAINDKYLRMLAEYENYRKRSAKEKESCYNDAFCDAVSVILPVLDNLERARGYTDAEAVTKGIELILKDIKATFEKLGISEIEAEGKKFDPNLHNAVLHIEDEKYGEGEIVEVLQKGYIMGERVIRHAMVKVAN
ncbi:MAG: nucleotide exchange factor GrpE [Clostridiales bacterium]|nr:nucleotide exchange factor GrpE [Clostridiales bacterium]HOA85051.1 nucleotide exchange factor GrpE [Bacillota bacterium]